MKDAEEQGSHAQTGATETWAPVSTKKTRPYPESQMVKRQESVGIGRLEAATVVSLLWTWYSTVMCRSTKMMIKVAKVEIT